jgi:type II secretory pathway pseudopilin PulG
VRRYQALTLIELLVVVAIIAIIEAILLPVFGAARARARMSSCSGNLHQLVLGLAMYRDDYGELPLHLSAANDGYVKSAALFVCPSDRAKGIHAGSSRMEGTLYLPTGVSYDYLPMWTEAQALGWWAPAPSFGNGKWDDLTPLLSCQWHWATTFHVDWSENAPGSKGWVLIATSQGSVRKVRVEDPLAALSPATYR